MAGVNSTGSTPAGGPSTSEAPTKLEIMQQQQELQKKKAEAAQQEEKKKVNQDMSTARSVTKGVGTVADIAGYGEVKTVTDVADVGMGAAQGGYNTATAENGQGFATGIAAASATAQASVDAGKEVKSDFTVGGQAGALEIEAGGYARDIDSTDKQIAALKADPKAPKDPKKFAESDTGKKVAALEARKKELQGEHEKTTLAAAEKRSEQAQKAADKKAKDAARVAKKEGSGTPAETETKKA